MFSNGVWLCLVNRERWGQGSNHRPLDPQAIVKTTIPCCSPKFVLLWNWIFSAYLKLRKQLYFPHLLFHSYSQSVPFNQVSLFTKRDKDTFDGIVKSLKMLQICTIFIHRVLHVFPGNYSAWFSIWPSKTIENFPILFENFLPTHCKFNKILSSLSNVRCWALFIEI